MKTPRELRIPAAPKRDAALARLAAKTGFYSANRLLAFVAFEVSRVKTPGALFHALAKFNDESKR
jgi:hypothetical protein